MARKPYTQMQREMEQIISQFIKTYKRMPNEKQLQAIAQKLQSRFALNMRSATDQQFKKIYMNTVSEVESNLRRELPFTKIDQNALFLLKNNPDFTRSLANLSNEMSQKVMEIVYEEYANPQGLNLRRMQKKLKTVTRLGDGRAELIARMETSRVSNTARHISYRKDERFNQFLFRWVGPSDSRTTEQSKEIQRLVGKGVTWSELQQIVIRVAAKYFPEFTVDPNTLVDHWNTRHSFVRTAIQTTNERRTDTQLLSA